MKQDKIRSKIKTALVVPALAMAVWGQATFVKADYTSPHKWSPMTMLDVSFDTNNLTLSVVDEAAKGVSGVYPFAILAPATEVAMIPEPATASLFFLSGLLFMKSKREFGKTMARNLSMRGAPPHVFGFQRSAQLGTRHFTRGHQGQSSRRVHHLAHALCNK